MMVELRRGSLLPTQSGREWVWRGARLPKFVKICAGPKSYLEVERRVLSPHWLGYGLRMGRNFMVVSLGLLKRKGFFPSRDEGMTWDPPSKIC